MRILKCIAASMLLYLGASATADAATIYIDPQYTGTEAGTMAQPYNAWSDIKWSAGNSYLFKRGTTLNTTGIFRPGASNVIIGSYGTGDRPRFVSSGSGVRVFDLGGLQNVMVQDIEIVSTNNAESCIHLFNSVRGTVMNVKVSGSEWGIRIVNCTGKNRIINSEVFKTGDDGVFISTVDTVEVTGTNIHDVNQKWFVNQSETYSGGDCLQTTNVKYCRISNNKFDHSTTGNKFCFISSSTISGLVPTGIIENNVFTRALTEKTGDNMYIVNGSNFIIRNNTIISGTIGIWNYNSNSKVYYNTFIGQSTCAIYAFAAAGSTLRAYNNVFYKTASVAFFQSENGIFKNNVFHTVSGRVFQGNIKPTSENNCYFSAANLGTLSSVGTNSMLKDPLFVDASTYNFRLQSTSPCISAGQVINDGTLSYPLKDLYDNTVTNTSACIGVNEACSSPTPTPTPTTNKVPTVSLSSPANGTNFTAPANITISASASDADGSISKVEFYNGTTKIGEKTSAPYSYTWSGVAAGTYAISAIAIDNASGRTQSSATTVYVTGSSTTINVSPIISLTSPANGGNFAAPASVVITANASDADGTISKVEFYNGTTKIGEKTSAPYTYTWNNVPFGKYDITAVAIDNMNAKGQTNASTIWVNGTTTTNKAPTVSITSPTSGYTSTVPKTLTITASASDADGTITKVEFYMGSYKIGEKTSAPYTYNCNFYNSASYTLTAVATDNSGNKTSSAPITINMTSSLKSGKVFEKASSTDEMSAKVYPNPNDGNFSVTLSQRPVKPLTIMITDMSGKVVYSETSSMQELKKDFSLTNIKSGIYFINISDFDKVNLSEKFIKE